MTPRLRPAFVLSLECATAIDAVGDVKVVNTDKWEPDCEQKPMNPRRLAGTTVVLVWSLACSQAAPNPLPAPEDPRVTSGLEQLRAATRPYHSVDSAAAAGYAREVRDCLVHEHHGAMGYHHSNPTFADAKVEIQRPEILLYERLPDGRYRLNGVEFIVPYRAWPRDSIPPTVMGQTMKREDNLKFFYLHVWAWTPNRDGLFSDFHPDVACAESTSKIFRPYTAPPS